MQFHVGPATYGVVRKYGLSMDGEPAKGLIDYDTHTIYLDALVVEHDAVEKVLRHEHGHAWEWHVGQPSEGESTASWAATVGQTFERDYAAGGRALGVLRLPTTGTPPPRTELKRIPALSSAFAAQRCCGACGQAVAAGSVASSDPIGLGGETYVTDRYMVCPVCDAVTVWRESCDECGTPSGGIMRARVLAGHDAAAFLIDNPAPPCEWNVA